MTWLRRALDRLCTGAGAVWWRMVEWPGRAESWRGVGGRWVWLAFCCWGAYRMWQHAIPARVAIVLALAVAAWRAVGVAAAAEPPDEEQDQEPEQPAAAPREEQLAYVLGVIHALIGDRTGAHVTDISEALVARGSIPAGLRTAAVRLSLERLGIPVRDQLKLGRANRPGVHRDDLAALGGGEAPATPPALTVVRDGGSAAA